MTARFIGALRLTTALAILGSIYWQVSDRIVHHTFHPEEYWVYFTIDTSLLMAVILIAGFAVAWFRHNQGAHWFEVARVALVGAYVVVAVVYNLLLRGDARDKRDVAAGYFWPTPPNEILHVWAPIVVVLELVLVTPAIRVRLVEAFWAAVFPLAWLVGTIIRGNINHWWPYWFINPEPNPTNPAHNGGVLGMITYICAITAVLIVTALLLLVVRAVASRLLPARAK